MLGLPTYLYQPGNTMFAILLFCYLTTFFCQIRAMEEISITREEETDPLIISSQRIYDTHNAQATKALLILMVDFLIREYPLDYTLVHQKFIANKQIVEACSGCNNPKNNVKILQKLTISPASPLAKGLLSPQAYSLFQTIVSAYIENLCTLASQYPHTKVPGFDAQSLMASLAQLDAQEKQTLSKFVKLEHMFVSRYLSILREHSLLARENLTAPILTIICIMLAGVPAVRYLLVPLMLKSYPNAPEIALWAVAIGTVSVVVALAVYGFYKYDTQSTRRFISGALNKQKRILEQALKALSAPLSAHASVQYV